MTLTLFDDTHWLFAQPVTPARGTVLDFSGTRLTATFTPMSGGSADPVAFASSDAAEGQGRITFVPAAGKTGPYFQFDIPASARKWRATNPTTIFADILRAPDPSKPTEVFPLGRVGASVQPGTGSTGIADSGQFPVLYPSQPYGGLPLATAMLVGPQGAPGTGGGLPPLPPDYATVNYTLGIVGGVLTWVLSGGVGPAPGVGSALDFSLPDNSGLLAALCIGFGASPPVPTSGLDFSNPDNSGLLAALCAGIAGAPQPIAAGLDFSTPANSGLLAVLCAGESASTPDPSGSLNFTIPTNSGLVAALGA